VITLVDYDWDPDLHAIWHESPGIPTPPPCLATDPNDMRKDLLSKVVEENVASLSRDRQRIWTCPLEAGQTVEIGVEKAFDQGTGYLVRL
jgi:hypothetical protein